MSESRSSKIRSSSAITLSELLAKSSITSAGKRRPLSCELDQSLSPSSSFEDLPEVDLEIDEVIGKGNYGSIARVHSSAGLNSSKTFVLKSVYDDRELVLETILARYIANNPDKLDNSVNIETPISVNNHLGLVSEEVPAGDLQNFLIKNVNTRVGDFSTEKIGKRLCQWIISMKNAQNNLHSLGVLHLDTAPRNYLKDNDYHLKITDYGLSRVIPSNGVIKCTSNEARPVRALDVRALIDKEFTIVSDLYALRTAIIEVIGLVLGKPVETLLTYARDKEEGNRASIKNNALSCAITKVGLYKYHNDTNKNELETLANNKSLCVFVKNLEFHLQQKLSEDKTHYQPIKNLLDCYKDYLTHMPTIIRKNDQYTPEEINEIRRKDYKRFTRATENFINTQEHSAKYNSLNVELERLKAISVTLPTNLSIIFQQLEIDKEQLEKKVQELDQIHKESEPNYATGSELEELEALRIRL